VVYLFFDRHLGKKKAAGEASANTVSNAL